MLCLHSQRPIAGCIFFATTLMGSQHVTDSIKPHKAAHQNTQQSAHVYH